MLSFFPRGVLDEILNLIESVSEDFPSYSCFYFAMKEILWPLFLIIKELKLFEHLTPHLDI